MKKILFITTRNPYSGRYSGDVIRAFKIINFLKKKNKVDIIFLSKKDEVKKIKKDKGSYFFIYPNLFLKILYCVFNLFRIKPMQFGFFFSKNMFNLIKKKANNYDLLFFHQIRSSQYLPKNFKGKVVLEMGDLYSENYFQTFKNLSYINFFKYIYLIESLLVKKIERKLFSYFNKIILFSKSEIKKVSKKFRKKIHYIGESTELINKKYLYSKKNYKILFIGNLGYVPNILACKDFIKNILPKIKNDIPEIQFHIIGNINRIDKFLFSFYKNVKILGPQKKLEKHVKGSICGMANLKIATGVQGKILTYMSYGLPVICSKRTSKNFNNDVLSYSNDNDLINKIYNLKNNKKFSEKFSKKSLACIRKLSWSKISLGYLKVI